MTKTLFTQIRDREIDADIVYEDDDIMAFHDINPQAPLHVLVVPREPIPTVNDLEPQHAELVGRLFLVARDIAADNGYREDGYRLVMNTNAGAGQTVFHIHLHLLAGRRFSWPPG
ncbi:MAG: histidine triad nucleotide-binding protein [Halofilum sp. (in: g-proteobacteria)]|nr:histidine triad nucleotide-binding protein [Halofilum sp. (in: g-proteobacteria)]